MMNAARDSRMLYIPLETLKSAIFMILLFLRSFFVKTPQAILVVSPAREPPNTSCLLKGVV